MDLNLCFTIAIASRGEAAARKIGKVEISEMFVRGDCQNRSDVFSMKVDVPEDVEFVSEGVESMMSEAYAKSILRFSSNLSHQWNKTSLLLCKSVATPTAIVT